jgi:acetylglutamate kinase
MSDERAGARDVATLLEALPYIREFHGKTVVIKYGGAAMEDASLREDFARDVVLLKYVGFRPVVVHGGGPDITAYMERLGLPVEFVGGLRVSDEATVGNLFRAARKLGPGGEDLGFVGEIERVDVDVLNHVAQDYIPVIASVGADREGNSYNVNADEAAGAVARALRAHKIVFLTDVAGWLRNPDDPASIISQATADEVELELGGISGGMHPKLRACVEAIHGGVGNAHIVDGRIPHSLLLELFTDAGIGTKIGASR